MLHREPIDRCALRICNIIESRWECNSSRLRINRMLNMCCRSVGVCVCLCLFYFFGRRSIMLCVYVCWHASKRAHNCASAKQMRKGVPRSRRIFVLTRRARKRAHQPRSFILCDLLLAWCPRHGTTTTTHGACALLHFTRVNINVCSTMNVPIYILCCLSISLEMILNAEFLLLWCSMDSQA